MKTHLPVLLLFALLAWGCDSAPQEAQLGGRYDGSQTVAFTSSSENVSIDFDIELDIQTPGASGAFTGDATVERGAVGNASPITFAGVVSGTIAGSAVMLAIRSSAVATRQARRGDGFAIDASGTLREDGTLVLSQTTFRDFAYGSSESFSLTLTK